MENIPAMSMVEAKEQILALISTLKLTEKEIHSLEDEAAKWKNRVDLARSQGADELLVEAEREADRVNAKLAGLREEESTLRDSIGVLQRQLPGLAARERSVDPDILEQELLMALGQTGEDVEAERTFRKLENESAASAALDALKNKMKGDVP